MTGVQTCALPIYKEFSKYINECTLKTPVSNTHSLIYFENSLYLSPTKVYRKLKGAIIENVE